MPESMRTNRGWLEEALYMRWCFFKATIYAMFKFKALWVKEDLDSGRIIRISVDDKVFYRYGK